MITEPKIFPALTGIRAIAAYMVYLHHCSHYSADEIGIVTKTIFSELYTGVTIFFVLSGFLIAYRYYDEIKINYRKYFVNRVARIYPMYFLLTTFTFLMVKYAHPEESLLSTYLYNITFLKGFFDELKFSGISQGWSLTVEECFYILAPLCFFFIRKNKISLIILPAFFILVGILLVALLGNDSFYGFMNSYQFMFSYTFWGRCVEFFIGIGLAILYKKISYSKTPRFNYTYCGIFLIIVCIIILGLIKGEHRYGTTVPAGIFVNNFVLPISGIALLFWGLINEDTVVSRILSSKIFVLLGKSSYIFYLIHVGVIHNIIFKYTHNHFIEFILLNIISILLFISLEEPINRFLRKKLT